MATMKIQAVKPRTCPLCGAELGPGCYNYYDLVDNGMTLYAFCHACKHHIEERYHATYSGCNIVDFNDGNPRIYMAWPDDIGEEVEVGA